MPRGSGAANRVPSVYVLVDQGSHPFVHRLMTIIIGCVFVGRGSILQDAHDLVFRDMSRSFRASSSASQIVSAAFPGMSWVFDMGFHFPVRGGPPALWR